MAQTIHQTCSGTVVEFLPPCPEECASSLLASEHFSKLHIWYWRSGGKEEESESSYSLLCQSWLNTQKKAVEHKTIQQVVQHQTWAERRWASWEITDKVWQSDKTRTTYNQTEQGLWQDVNAGIEMSPIYRTRTWKQGHSLVYNETGYNTSMQSTP